jgi:hypothetical protein
VERPNAFGFDSDDSFERECAERLTVNDGTEQTACCNVCLLFTPDLMPLGKFYTKACTCCANQTGVQSTYLSDCVKALNAPIFTDERCQAERPATMPGFVSVATPTKRWCREKCDESACTAFCQSQGAAAPAGETNCTDLVGTVYCACRPPDPDTPCVAEVGETYCGVRGTYPNGAPATCVTAECGDGIIRSECPRRLDLQEVCETNATYSPNGCPPGKRCNDCKTCEPCQCNPETNQGCEGGQTCNNNCQCDGPLPCSRDPRERARGDWCSESSNWCGRGLVCDTAECRCKSQGTCGDGICDSAAGEQTAGPTACPQDCPVVCGDGKCNVAGGEANPVLETYCEQDCQEVSCCRETGGCPSEQLYSCPGDCCCCPRGAICQYDGIYTCGV